VIVVFFPSLLDTGDRKGIWPINILWFSAEVTGWRKVRRGTG